MLLPLGGGGKQGTLRKCLFDGKITTDVITIDKIIYCLFYPPTNTCKQSYKHETESKQSDSGYY